jgi:hypothetical protein
MKKHTLSFLFILTSFYSFAFEGMWIPSVLNAAFDDMKANGLKLSKEEIYSINNTSLKDGIVIFGGGCTGEMVSNEGLLFTNHHCGFDNIQYHSSVEHDYLKNGFWAMNREQELACPGLTATFVIEMRDVTDEVLKGMIGVDDKDRAAKMRDLFNTIANKAKEESKCEGFVRGFNYNTQFFLVLTKTYTDVRLVGAPPSCIGKFGGDTDNWVWPRHTGDFSVFRIYANDKNEPAEYSATNKPFKPAHHFPISLKGVKEGDFTMVYGFPGRTEHLLTSAGVAYNHEQLAPMRIDFREKNLSVINAAMKSSDALRIKYAAKQSSVANAYKKWQGQELGLNKFNAIQLKKDEEAKWLEIAKLSNKELEYSNLLSTIDKLYKDYYGVNMAAAAYSEFVFNGPEIFALYQDFHEIASEEAKLKKGNQWEGKMNEFLETAKAFYKDYDLETDKKRFVAMSSMYEQFTKGVIHFEHSKLSREAAADLWFKQSLVADSAAFLGMIRSFSKDTFVSMSGKSKKYAKRLEKEHLYAQALALSNYYMNTLVPAKREFNAKHDQLMEKYVFLLEEMRGKKEKWCDANSTLRLTYGRVEGSSPVDGMAYTPFTTGQGILDKNSTGNPDFEINDRLKMLLKNKEFGSYGVNGNLPVCFTGSNHTTGGNSGSPALNGDGEWIGINFDRTWESTMSDLYFNSEICRNVMTDARYVLWVIDIYAGAGHLLEEMTIRR